MERVKNFDSLHEAIDASVRLVGLMEETLASAREAEKRLKTLISGGHGDQSASPRPAPEGFPSATLLFNRLLGLAESLREHSESLSRLVGYGGPGDGGVPR